MTYIVIQKEINLVQNIIIKLTNKFIKRKNVRSLNNIT